MDKKTIVLGASAKADKYSNMCVKKLLAKGHTVVAIGNKAGLIEHLPIVEELLPHSVVDTITIYLSPINQKKYYEYILAIKPLRIIFNPGTENDELEQLALKNNIKVANACTLVMLSTNQY